MAEQASEKKERDGDGDRAKEERNITMEGIQTALWF